MNNYPEWWNTTVTIFNKFIDPQTYVVKWYSTVVENCFWKYTGNKITIGTTVIDTDSTLCRIPKDDRYLPRYEWEQLSNDKMGEYFSLGVGDIICKNSVNAIIDEYAEGQRSSDLIERYKQSNSCIIVQSYTDNTDGGRVNEHYYVTGV